MPLELIHSRKRIMKNNSYIQLATSDKCTGCAACASVCPTRSISMREDREGFLQPHIDKKTCIGCHKCEKTCPAINDIYVNKFISHAYNAQTNDECALKKSSSGGAFYELSRYVIARRGVIFGVKFKGIHVQHDCAETLYGVEAFMGSKYIQSEIGNSYIQAKSFLEQGRWVLYSGTPCQIAGLKRYLNRDYEKLITIDLICHGVPSPGIWEKYIQRLMRKIDAGDIKDIRFRIKDVDNVGRNNSYFFFFFFLRDYQWHSYGEERMKNLFYAYFTRHIFRSSCYQCPFRAINISYADITIGDAVSEIQHLKNDIPSTIIVHTMKGEDVCREISEHLGVLTPLQDVYVNEYFEEARKAELIERNIRPYKLSNRLAMIFPLEYLKWIWMHDKLYVVLKRKLKKTWKKNTK